MEYFPAALEKLVEKAGGNICGRMAILAEGEAARARSGWRSMC